MNEERNNFNFTNCKYISNKWKKNIWNRIKKEFNCEIKRLFNINLIKVQVVITLHSKKSKYNKKESDIKLKTKCQIINKNSDLTIIYNKNIKNYLQNQLHNFKKYSKKTIKISYVQIYLYTKSTNNNYTINNKSILVNFDSLCIKFKNLKIY